MNESIAVALVAIVGVVGLIVTAYAVIKIIINTTREAYSDKNDKEK